MHVSSEQVRVRCRLALRGLNPGTLLPVYLCITCTFSSVSRLHRRNLPRRVSKDIIVHIIKLKSADTSSSCQKVLVGFQLDCRSSRTSCWAFVRSRQSTVRYTHLLRTCSFPPSLVHRVRFGLGKARFNTKS